MNDGPATDSFSRRCRPCGCDSARPVWRRGAGRRGGRLIPVYRTRFFGHKVALSGGPHDGVAPGGSGVARAAQAVLLDQPLGVVAGDEVADGVTDLVDGLVDATVHDLLLQRAKESFDDTVRLGLANERVAGAHAPEADLVMEMFGEERAAMVVSQRHATGSAGIDMTEDIAHGHADGLDGGVAIAALGDMPAQRLGVPVLDHAEQPDLAVLDGDDLGVSRPKEFHLRPLAEPDVNLSAHPAPTTLRYDRYPIDQ